MHTSFVLLLVYLTISLFYREVCGQKLNFPNKDDESIKDYEEEKDLPSKATELKSKSFDPFNVKLFRVKWCRPDILRFCSKASYQDNYAILQCLQKDQQTLNSVAKECKTFILTYKTALTTSEKFRKATETMCGASLIEQTGCNSVGK